MDVGLSYEFLMMNCNPTALVEIYKLLQVMRQSMEGQELNYDGVFRDFFDNPTNAATFRYLCTKYDPEVDKPQNISFSVTEDCGEIRVTIWDEGGLNTSVQFVLNADGTPVGFSVSD